MLCDPRRLWLAVIALHGVAAVRDATEKSYAKVVACKSAFDRCTDWADTHMLNDTAGYTSHLKSCELRHTSCVRADLWFGRYSVDGKEPCETGATWSNNINDVYQGIFGAACDDDARRMTATYFNTEVFERAAATEVTKLFVYDELYNMFQLIGCALHAEYEDLKTSFWPYAAQVRGPVDGVSAVRALAMAAAFAISQSSGGIINPRLVDASLLMLRRLWFGEAGSELVGLRFMIDTHPRLVKRHGFSRCEVAKEGWQISGITRFADKSFGFVPDVLYHILECVPEMGSCVLLRDGKYIDAPRLFVNLQHKLEKEMQDALKKVAEVAQVTLERSEVAFDAFVNVFTQ